jgi:purine nucleosidase/pyrimidine-specific ribonucleoside hydrolase
VIGLLYFLQHPDVSVRALTISCGQAHPEIFTPHLPRMLAQLGRPLIPAAAGRLTPLKGNNAFPPPWRKAIDTLLGIDLPEPQGALHPLPAADLIVEVLNDSPEPVTLFVCGPHTNVAEALRLDPDIREKIASVQVMGGALYVPGNIASEWPASDNWVAEWNIWVDPVAASEVLSSGLPVCITPLDATDQVIWTGDDADIWAAAGTPEGRLAAEILRRYLDHLRDLLPQGIYLWDLVAAAHVTNPELSQAEQLHLQIVTEPSEEQGRTVVVGDQPPNATAFLEPRADELKQLVAQTLALPRDGGPTR